MALYSIWHSNQEWRSIGADTVDSKLNNLQIVNYFHCIIYYIECKKLKLQNTFQTYDENKLGKYAKLTLYFSKISINTILDKF